MPGLVVVHRDVLLQAGIEFQVLEGVLGGEERRCQIVVAVADEDLEERVLRHCSAQGFGDIDILVLEFAVITDPPYYDSVPYADLSDFFYVWLKRSIGSLYPDLFATPLSPKAEEITEMYDRLGTWGAVAKELDVTTTVLRKYREDAGLL